MNLLTPEEAKKIMGNNFFGIKNITKHFGIETSSIMLANLKRVPFSKKVLKDYKDSHMLVASPVMSREALSKAPMNIGNFFLIEISLISKLVLRPSFIKQKANWCLISKIHSPFITNEYRKMQQFTSGKKTLAFLITSYGTQSNKGADICTNKFFANINTGAPRPLNNRPDELEKRKIFNVIPSGL